MSESHKPVPPESVLPTQADASTTEGNQPPVPVAEEPVFSANPAWPTTEPVAYDRRPGASRQIPITVWLAALLVPYAIGATIGIVYLMQQKQRSKTAHILESIPDQGLYEDFFDGRRRETPLPLSKASEQPPATKVIPPTEPVLPDMVPLKLGETRRVGMLSIKPVSINRKPLVYSYRSGKAQVAGDEVLVLLLSVKNEGPLIFHPNDETFNRAMVQESKGPVYTFLELGKERFYGAVNDPTLERAAVRVPSALLPGETAEIEVVADRNSDGSKLAAKLIQPGDQGVWRVHLRKGKEEITMLSGKRRSVWVTTVVPVEFRDGDVK